MFFRCLGTSWRMSAAWWMWRINLSEPSALKLTRNVKRWACEFVPRNARGHKTDRFMEREWSRLDASHCFGSVPLSFWKHQRWHVLKYDSMIQCWCYVSKNSLNMFSALEASGNQAIRVWRVQWRRDDSLQPQSLRTGCCASLWLHPSSS